MKRLIIILVICCGIISIASAASKIKKTPPAVTITITGIKDAALKNADTRVNEYRKQLGKIPTRNAIKMFYDELPKTVSDAIKPYGYFKAQFSKHIRFQNKRAFITINVSPGKRLKFTSLVLVISGPGRNEKRFFELKKHFPIKVGHDFNSVKYERAKDALSNLANNLGFFKAKIVKSKIVVNLKKYTAHVFIHFETGSRYRFGHTTFTHSQLATSFLKRFLTYRYGNYYDAAEVENTQDGLANSAYFNRVLVTPKTGKTKGDIVPIKVHLTPATKWQYTFGAGYGTDTGPRATAGVTNNWVNQWGHRFDFNAFGSMQNSQAIAHYIIPGRRPSKDQYIFSGGFAYIDQAAGAASNANAANNTNTAKSSKVGFTYQTLLNGWKLTASLYALYEKYNLTLQNNQRINTNAKMVYPSLRLSRRRVDQPINPNNGYYLGLHLSGAYKGALSTTTFTQYAITAKYLVSIFHKHTRFLLRSQLGITSINNIQNLPLTLQLWAGGAQSIRGYDYNSIGPGREIYVGSAEVQQRVKGNWFVAGFVDAGNVADNIFISPIKIGVGPALVWDSPVGTLEISVAWAIREKGHPWKIQFNMGPLI